MLYFPGKSTFIICHIVYQNYHQLSQYYIRIGKHISNEGKVNFHMFFERYYTGSRLVSPQLSVNLHQLDVNFENVNHEIDQISTNTSRYTTFCAANVYIFVYIFIGTALVPLKS